MPSLRSRHLQAYRWPRVSECRAWASCGDGALACNAHPVPRASLSASHAGARQHTSAGPYVTPGIQATTGSGESQALPSANRRPVPPGLVARGQVQRESWELRAPLPPPQDAGERAVGCTLPGERHAWHAAGEQLSFGVPPGHRARSAIQGTDHPRCPCSLLCLRGEPDPLGRASGQATRCLGTGEEGAGPARRPGLRRKSIRERRAGSLTVSSEREARTCAGNVYT